MKQYQKNIDGKTVIKTKEDIIIHRNGMNTFNPTEEMLLEDGWVEYVIPEPTEEELFSRALQDKKQDILAFDASQDVNEFYINGLSVWLDKATRAGLKLRFEAEMAMGNEATVLWYKGTQFPLPLSQAMRMLYAIEVYASACYDNTQQHLANIEAITTIEELEAYDYTLGYPEKLNF